MLSESKPDKRKKSGKDKADKRKESAKSKDKVSYTVLIVCTVIKVS